MVERLTFRRRHCYATKSNKVQKVKTPGCRHALSNCLCTSSPPPSLPIVCSAFVTTCALH